MAVQGGAEEDVYATLLLSDTYLPGALVLAHSLRDGLTTKKLAVLVTLDTVSADAITELKAVYHYVIPVPRIRNSEPANLQLMNRADLHSAFTKINLWKQTQFRKIVYIDADVVAYRAPDELFEISHPFSAAPDIGWPDLFNTGVMVLTPGMSDYYAMMAMAERSVSFDGADQGLLNMHFRNNYNRLSFTYNVTPSAHYQYIPAYRHFQSSINMVHFIGPEKPWFVGRGQGTSADDSPMDAITARWWAVYDRHYGVPSTAPAPPAARLSTTATEVTQPGRELVQYLTKGEYQPNTTYVGPASKPHSGDHLGHEQRLEQSHPESSHHHDAPGPGAYGSHHDHHHQYREAHGQGDPQPGAFFQQPQLSSSVLNNVGGTQAEARKEQIHAEAFPPPPPELEQKPPPFQPSMSSWDAQRHPPPTDSKPEAENFPATIYQMSQDSAPFVAPERYPSPPRDMWYEVPKEPPAPRSEPPKAIFPWETDRPAPTRVFTDLPSRQDQYGTGFTGTQLEASMFEQKNEPATPVTPTIQVTPSDPWTSFSRANAWDDVPEIERYVDSIQKHQRSRSLKGPGVIKLPAPGDGVEEFAWQRHGSKLTDFPSEQERPSLPVTPAPIRRPRFWGGGGPGISEDNDDPQLPRAEGVPRQSEWDPVAQLQKLAKQQSEVLLQKLGSGHRDSSDLPPRPLPFGSEELVSPTYVAQSAQMPSPRPVKGTASSSTVRSTETDRETTPRISSSQQDLAAASAVSETPVPGQGSSGLWLQSERGKGFAAREPPSQPPGKSS